MKITDKVKFKDGRPYIVYIGKRGAEKNYGIIKTCPVCNDKFFTSHNNPTCSRSCSKKMSLNPMWTTGRYPDSKGYIVIRKPDHPFATKQGLVYEHRLVLEKHLGRYLSPEERIHHKDGNRSNNQIPNLHL
ncbi:HNH endonuclease, partial [Candidatus Pacearchaeota archaeon]|nr:HNH endonuclease [Candidatus Pacearchaeota archaeon]